MTTEATRPSGDDLPPIDEAAILMLAMGQDEAANVLKYLAPREVQRVGAAMSALGRVNARQMDRVMNHFLETVSGNDGPAMGANDYLRMMLIGALGHRRAGSVLDRLVGAGSNRLDTRKWMGCRAIADFLCHEPPPMQAITLAYLKPAQAAEVLSYLAGAAVRSDLIIRVAGLEPVPAGGRRESYAMLESAAGKRPPGHVPTLGGRRAAAAIMMQMEDAAAVAVMAGIRERDQTLADEIQALMVAGRPPKVTP